MGTPTSKRKTVDLTKHAELVRLYRQAIQDEKAIKAYKDNLGGKLRKLIGNAEQAEVNGVPVLTYARTESWAWAKFAETHPEIADKYRITVTKEGLDTDKILADHPALVAAFQSRQFLVK